MFSKRAAWDSPLNRLTLARRAHVGALHDLTEANPTRVGISYPIEELSEALARGAGARYDPDPRGLASARKAVALTLDCDPDDLILTASTSEAYSFLLKLLTDPGDEIITATPAYPLIEHLASMEMVHLRSFPLELHRRWEIDSGQILPQITSRTRALLVVNPNNPTGSYVSSDEQSALATLGVPIISDEVFLDYPLDGNGSTFVREDALTFTLGGLSKSAGLPHFKLAWIRVSGPGKREAIAGLEQIADNFLSVATPVQAALGDLLRLAPRIREQIAARVRSNLETLRGQLAQIPAAEVLPVEGGWTAVVRVPKLQPDEELALRLLERGVLIQPGYFFDFEGEGFLVVSLLTEPDTFAAGVTITAAAGKEWWRG
ncbi:MAG TPA: pyridoxal phosphate-dependent aminotransferase [Thermoanaerobaculia bacterium]